MIRTAVIAMLSAVGLGTTPQPAPEVIRSPANSSVWTLRSQDANLDQVRFTLEARADGQAQLGLTFHAEGDRGRGNMSGPWSWEELKGFDAQALTTTEGPVSFLIDAAAGDLNCSGVASGGMAAGRCAFDPDEAFAADLERRVGARPQTRHLFHLALTDFNPALLDVLEAQGYARPDLDQVIAAAIHGVDAGYVQDVARSGYRLGTVDELVGFRIHGVTADYVAAMATLGPRFRDLPADEIMALAIHGVSPDYVRQMEGLGFGGDAEAVVALKIHGVTAEGVRALAAAGYGDLTVDQQLAFAIHEVTPAFIRDMAEAGYDDLTPDQLVSLRIHGVSPDYARRMAREGVRERASAD